MSDGEREYHAPKSVEYTSDLGSVLDTAKSLICSERRKDYGDARTGFKNIAVMWSEYLGVPITASNVAIMMVLLKVCREKERHKTDNLIDMAGYAALADYVHEYVHE